MKVMKKSILLFLGMILCIGGYAQTLLGAWEGHYEAENGEMLTVVLIFAEGYQVKTTYNSKSGDFLATKGGSWESVDNVITETVEFDSKNPEKVGKEVKYTFSIQDSTLKIKDSKLDFKRIDNGTPGALEGAWLMSGRIKNGEKQLRDTSGPRKTMKILSGTRFQWIAYNTATQEFLATGGGAYTTENGKYTENIAFFSRDVSRVGMELQFNFELKAGNWHHSGLSTKGDPINEIWSKRK